LANDCCRICAYRRVVFKRYVLLTSNSLANQFQLPVLFYVLAFILFNINAVSALSLSLAWVFAASRWIHAFVHVTSNNIPLRLSFFVE